MPTPPPLRLLVAACQYPALLLDDELSNGAGRPSPAYRAMRRLAQRAREQPPSAIVWTGDRIYVDATGGLFDPAVTTGDDVEQLEHALYRAYRDAALRPGWPDVCNHRGVHTIDDHEIGDNWEPSLHAGRNELLQRMASAGRAKFLRERWPGLSAKALEATPLWSAEVLAGHWGLFAADTRTERSARDPRRIGEATLMGPRQRAAFVQWLRDVNAANRFIVSPSMLLPRHLVIAEVDEAAAAPGPAATAAAPNRHGLGGMPGAARAAALRSDAWDGYPGSLHALLAVLADEQLQDRIFLSGDEHIACFADITVCSLDPGARAVRLSSLHTGAMYAPYPFANGGRAEFAERETFEFDGPPGARSRRYRCCVEARFAEGAGDGFTEVAIDGAGRASAIYHGERGTLCWPFGDGSR